MSRWNSKRKRSKQAMGFKPNRLEIENAVSDFLKKGGTIKKVVVNEQSYKDFLSLNELPSAADDFLNGQ